MRRRRRLGSTTKRLYRVGDKLYVLYNARIRRCRCRGVRTRWIRERKRVTWSRAALSTFFSLLFIFIFFFLFRLRAFRPSPHAGTVAITSTHCAAVIHAAACAAHWFEHNVLLPLILYYMNASHPTANLPWGRAIDPPTPPGTCRWHVVRNPRAKLPHAHPPLYGSPVVFFSSQKFARFFHSSTGRSERRLHADRRCFSLLIMVSTGLR